MQVEVLGDWPWNIQTRLSSENASPGQLETVMLFTHAPSLVITFGHAVQSGEH
ncbi:hypothetical protein PSYPI_14003 [Pseudomonas syringae pv. pisi str. 1704B]|uniref:Uncharacterized protein n=1 Tax=Pseudomonas syringae pv. pisi str. 1704B TaxID=629263 RepID=F3G8N5_PSESJ|nr:hypothetical protein PSYPI_14003 [Pseudomonas syringae pv. pisi str. 1704B]